VAGPHARRAARRGRHVGGVQSSARYGRAEAPHCVAVATRRRTVALEQQRANTGATRYRARPSFSPSARSCASLPSPVPSSPSPPHRDAPFADRAVPARQGLRWTCRARRGRPGAGMNNSCAARTIYETGSRANDMGLPRVRRGAIAYAGANFNATGSVGRIRHGLLRPVLELQNGLSVELLARAMPRHAAPRGISRPTRDCVCATRGRDTNVGAKDTSVATLFDVAALCVTVGSPSAATPQTWDRSSRPTLSGLAAPVHGPRGASGTSSPAVAPWATNSVHRHRPRAAFTAGLVDRGSPTRPPTRLLAPGSVWVVVAARPPAPLGLTDSSRKRTAADCRRAMDAGSGTSIEAPGRPCMHLRLQPRDFRRPSLRGAPNQLGGLQFFRRLSIRD
jgi:hypothetical protein